MNNVSGLRSIFSMLDLVLPVACAGPSVWAPHPAAGNTASVPGPYGGALSREARQVSRIANVNGDRDYLMLDKARGKIIVFEGGQATFMGAALTGEYRVDYLLPDATRKSFHETTGLKYKVTPAGRYTVSAGFDPAYGDTLDVNEIQGVDWDIAIHKVWLGAPAEHRDLRLLRVPRRRQTHHVWLHRRRWTDDEARYWRVCPMKIRNAALHILPQDENLIMKFFQPRDAVSSKTSSRGWKNFILHPATKC